MGGYWFITGTWLLGFSRIGSNLNNAKVEKIHKICSLDFFGETSFHNSGQLWLCPRNLFYGRFWVQNRRFIFVLLLFFFLIKGPGVNFYLVLFCYALECSLNLVFIRRLFWCSRGYCHLLFLALFLCCY